jgi:sialate O-acetylesterase
MVLQRDKPNAFWGWTTPGAKVTVSVAGRKAVGTAGPDGRWLARLTPPKVGGPYKVVVEGGQRVELDDVLVGDVWLCTGQSNMELGLSQAMNGAQEVAAANEPNIRLYMAGRQVGYSPKATVAGTWKTCTPETVTQEGWGGFSAVGYYFGRKLQRELKVPVGLVEDCWGGTSAEAWTSSTALRPLGDFDPQLATLDRLKGEGGPVFGTYTNLWLTENDRGVREGWQVENLDESAWTSATVPGPLTSSGSVPPRGAVWFRKTVNVPSGGEATIFLNRVDDTDTTWVNGKLLGTTSFDWAWRRYPVTLKPGRNVIAVRVFTSGKPDVFLGKPDEMLIELADGTHIPLAGEWKSRTGLNIAILSSRPRDNEPNPTVPTVLYNGMIAPLAPMAIRGAIWYQGETNAGRGAQYRRLLPAMIADWRRTFGQGDFPFYIVSLANFMRRDPNPGDDNWAELREAQALTAQTVPKSGLAVTIDVGDAADIHPKDKKTVGERLAANALALEYRRKVEYSGPVYRSMKREGDAIRLTFTHANGMTSKGKLEGFAVAGADRKWHWADGRIDGNTVVVRSSEVPEPVAVRYAWGHNPAATLYNGAGLPAVPFRTDDWPLLSANNR